MAEASLTGVIKLILMLIGVVVALRFIGQLMIAKRNVEEERQLAERERAFQKERSEKLKNFGKVSVVSKKNRPSTAAPPAEDIDFEELN